MPTSDQIKDKFKKLSPQIRRVLVSPELFSITNSIATSNSLAPEQKRGLDEVVNGILMEFELKENLVNKITDDLNLEIEKAQKIATEVEQKILNRLDAIHQKIEMYADKGEKQESSKDVDQQLTQKIPTQQPKEPQTQNSVGQSFEQIILNQARAMRPAVASSNQVENSSQQPVASSQEKMEEKPKAIHDYAPGQDPYREPLE